TRWHYKSEFYSLLFAVSELLESYHFPPENYSRMKKMLATFSSEVDQVVANRDNPQSVKVTMPYVLDFVATITAQTTHKKQRVERNSVIRHLLIMHLVPKDNKRLFNEEEKRIIWDIAKDKKCVICGEKVLDFDDYEPHHDKPHSKGGLTEINNGRIAHKKCNRSKGAR
ncbi:MAG: HNH endonuclease signature motif containing protein, partial [Nitrososphaerales archaeon]